MRSLIGLPIKLITNGDITVIDTQDENVKKCFGPTYGTQHSTHGTISKAEPVVDISREWLDKTLSGEWSIDTPVRYEVKIRVTVQCNNREYHWELTPEYINKYLLDKGRIK